MQLTRTNQIEGSIPSLETQAFTIAGNAKAFRVLVDTMYSNKILAVIREIWSNAFDAHVEGDFENFAFDCHLPDMTDPTFRVRDYGIGMSHDMVMHLYSTMFGSSKDLDNMMVGGFGIGSKAPFAYADSFMVTCWDGSEKRSYMAAIAEDGVPAISHLSTEPSDALRGVEISLVVRPGDFEAFRREAVRLAMAFDPLPEIAGVDLTPPEPVFVADDATFVVFTEDSVPDYEDLNIRQGCVVYGVSDWTVTTPIRKLLKHGKIVIDLPIGSVSVAASREALSLDEDTVITLAEAQQYVIDKVSNELYAEADKCKTHLEALEFWYSPDKGKGGVSDVFQITPKWKGEVLNAHVEIPETVRPKIRTGNDKSFADWKHINFQSRNEYQIAFSDDRKVVRSQLRLRQWTGGRGYYSANKIYVANPDPALFPMLKELVGFTDNQFIWVGDLADPGPPQRTARIGGKTGLMGVSNLSGAGMTNLPPAYVFMEVERYSNPNAERLQKMYRSLVKCGAPDVPLLLFTSGAVKRLAPNMDNEIHRFRSTWISANYARLVQRYGEIAAANQMQRAGLGAKISFAPEKGDEAYAINQVIGYDGTQKSHKITNAIVGQYRAKYPMLFDPQDKANRQAYIALCDKA